MLGNGLSRYENHLKVIALDAPAHSSIPSDLAQALAELGAIRNVLVRRAGRIDQRPLKNAPSVGRRYKEDELVRISRDAYRKNSVAVRCYAAEIQFRSFATGLRYLKEKDAPRLSDWRSYYRLGA